MRASRREPVVLSRSVRALQVPSGEEVTLEEGCGALITQQLGGSFTVYIDGSLFRIDGADADAIGKAPIEPKAYAENPSDDDVLAMVWDELREVYDPEIPCSVVDLGLIYACEIHPIEGQDGLRVFVQMTVTAPGCGMGEQLIREVGERLDRLPRVDDYTVELAYDPPWDRSMMSEVARLQLGMM
jgi:probable FeS assembly SUF system protein SufT